MVSESTKIFGKKFHFLEGHNTFNDLILCQQSDIINTLKDLRTKNSSQFALGFVLQNR